MKPYRTICPVNGDDDVAIADHETDVDAMRCCMRNDLGGSIYIKRGEFYAFSSRIGAKQVAQKRPSAHVCADAVAGG